jgi:hypothetical protein
MTLQERALVDLATALSDAGIPYMVIGGLANAVWGEPRATLDIDVTVALEPEALDRLITAVVPLFQPLVPDPASFVRETHVLPVASEQGVRADLILGVLPFELLAIERATAISIQQQDVRFCTAEDLILLKAVSTRTRDLDDVQGILRRRIDSLDLEYLEPRIRELADLLERPEIVERWLSWKEEASP